MKLFRCLKKEINILWGSPEEQAHFYQLSLKGSTLLHYKLSWGTQN